MAGKLWLGNWQSFANENELYAECIVCYTKVNQ
jgi:hypothetical protein